LIIKDLGIEDNKFVEKQFEVFLKMVAEEGFEPSRPKAGGYEPPEIPDFSHSAV